MSSPETIVAQATPVGEGAVGIIRLSGPNSKSILDQVFFGKTSASKFKSHRLYFGEIRDDQTTLDQVLAVWMKSPQSFTGEEVVEIHTHGSPVVLLSLLRLFTKLGARLAEPGEFSKRAFLNGKIDLTQAEAIADLISAKSEWAAKNAISQLSGTLRETIERLRETLIRFLAEVEAGFDFSEEDIQFFKKEEGLKLLNAILLEIEGLLSGFETGQLYKEGLKIALIGRPNVGKSSLLNWILKEEKAITHAEAGTTRDVIVGERKIAGIPFYFYDTAGIREATHVVEQEGIRRSKEALDKADLVFILCDTSQPILAEDRKLISEIAEKKLYILICTKSDLPQKWDLTHEFSNEIPKVKISSKTNKGLESLFETVQKLVFKKELLQDHNYVLNNVRHRDSLNLSRITLKALIDRWMGDQLPDECLAEELRIIIRNLGEITGQISSEDILDTLFSQFCIGK